MHTFGDARANELEHAAVGVLPCHRPGGAEETGRGVPGTRLGKDGAADGGVRHAAGQVEEPCRRL